MKKSRVGIVKKGVISSLVRVIGRLLKDANPQTVKENIADVVTKRCGEKDGKIFAGCFEGDKWEPEDDLVNLIYDRMMEAGMDQNAQERVEPEAAAVEPLMKRAKMDEVIANVGKKDPPETSSVSTKDDDEDDIQVVFVGEKKKPSNIPRTKLIMIPSTNLSTIPSTNLSTIPSTNLSTIPGTNWSTIPSTNLSTIPGTNWSTIPSTNLSTIPGTNWSTIPSTNLSTIPGTNWSTIPSTNWSTIPSTNLSTIPSTDLITMPSPDNLTSEAAMQRLRILITEAMQMRPGDEEGIPLEKLRQLNQLREFMRTGSSVRVSVVPNPLLTSTTTTNHQTQDLSGEDANKNVPTSSGTHREDFNSEKLKTCEDESNGNVEDSTSTQAISIMEEVDGTSEMTELTPPASPVETLDEENAVGGSKCVPVDAGLYQTLDELMNTPLEDWFKNSKLLELPFKYESTAIANAIFELISNTERSDIEAEMIIEFSLTTCALLPRFVSLLAVMRHLMMTYPVKYQHLSAILCEKFCEKITGKGGETLMGNERFMVHVGRFFGAALKVCQGVDIEAIVVTVAGVKGPYIYSLMYGMLSSDNEGVLNLTTGVSGWENLDLWVRGVLVTIMRGSSFSHSMWRGAVKIFLNTLGLASLVPADLNYEKHLLGMLKEVIEIKNEEALKKGRRIIAMMMVQIGWPWLREAAEGLFGECEGLWKTSAISDGAFGEVVLKGVGTAVAWMRKENTPENLTELKQLMAKYMDADYPPSIQVAAGSALELLEKVVLRSPGKPLVHWTYAKIDESLRGETQKVASGSNGDSFDRDEKKGDTAGTSSGQW